MHPCMHVTATPSSSVAVRLATRTFLPTPSHSSLCSLSIVAPMACANAWLAHVHAVGGDLEPPPDPEIPTEYLQKPRRRPAPEAYLASSPPSTCTSFARPKRRRAALSEIGAPNQKRQRALDAPAHAMSRSPTRKSSRQTRTGKARITTNEAPVVENIIPAVERILLATQHVVDPNTTPRPAHQKRAAPPALPIPDLHTRPAPVLTPSVSEEHADEDAEDTEDAEVESTYESITSKWSRSPTRRMVDLQIAKKPVVPKTATSSTDVPQDVRTLYKAIQALARRSKGVIPLGIEVQLRGMLLTAF